MEDDSAFTVTFARDGGVQTLEHNGLREDFTWSQGSGLHEYRATIGDARATGRVFIDGDTFHVFCLGHALAFEWQNLLAHAADAEHGEGRLTAPMPGKVIAVLVEPGVVVEKRAPHKQSLHGPHDCAQAAQKWGTSETTNLPAAVSMGQPQRLRFLRYRQSRTAPRAGPGC